MALTLWAMAAGAPGDAATGSPNARNSMTGDATQRPELADVWTWKDIKDRTRFVGHPVGQITILNRYQEPDPNVIGVPESADRMLDAEFADRERRGFDLVVNGTFFDNATEAPSGSVMRPGGSFYQGSVKTANRGGVAVLQDGTIVLGRATSVTAGGIDSHFGSTSPVAQFMGGGALLVEGRRAVPSHDLEAIQLFDQVGQKRCAPGTGGLNADQFYSTHHAVVAVRKGQVYVLVNEVPLTGAELQAELIGNEFDAAIKFDGGSKCYFNDGGVSGFTYESGNVNPTGFGIRVATFYVVGYLAEMNVLKERKEDEGLDEFYDKLKVADVEFVAGPELALLQIDATAMPPYEADMFSPGMRLSLPFKGSATEVGKGSTTVDFPLMLEVVEISRDEKALLHKYPELQRQVDEPQYEKLSPLLHLRRKDGTGSLDITEPDGSVKIVTGPLAPGWTPSGKSKYLEQAKKIPALFDCFVATAAYRTYDNEQLRTFRRFRDDLLLQSRPGRRLVEAYYRYGPSLALKMRRRPEVSRAAVRLLDRLAGLMGSVDWRRPAARALAAPVLYAVDALVGMSSRGLDRWAGSPIDEAGSWEAILGPVLPGFEQPATEKGAIRLRPRHQPPPAPHRSALRE